MATTGWFVSPWWSPTIRQSWRSYGKAPSVNAIGFSCMWHRCISDQFTIFICCKYGIRRSQWTPFAKTMCSYSCRPSMSEWPHTNLATAKRVLGCLDWRSSSNTRWTEETPEAIAFRKKVMERPYWQIGLLCRRSLWRRSQTRATAAMRTSDSGHRPWPQDHGLH